MHSKPAALLLLVVILSAMLAPLHTAFAQSTPRFAPRIVGQVGGVTNSIAYAGGQLYFNVGPRIVRMAVPAATPDQPAKPAKYGAMLPGVPEDIKVVGKYVYVALGSAGVAIVDAATLGLVRVASLYEPPLEEPPAPDRFAVDVVVSSQYLYVAAGPTGVLVYDLGLDGNGLNLIQTKTFANPIRNITDLEVQASVIGGVMRRTLFAAASNDTADPTQRGGVLRFDITVSPTLDAPTAVKDEINVNALEVAETYVYAAGQSAFYVLNASSLAQLNADFPLQRPALYLNLGPSAETVFMMSANGLEVIDVSTPEMPAFKTAAPFPTQGSVKDLASVDFADRTNTYLYVADFDAGLSIVTSLNSAPQNLAMLAPGYVAAKVAIARVVAAGVDQMFEYGSSVTLWALDTADLGALHYLGNGVPVAGSFNALAVHDDQVLASAAVAGLRRYRITQGGDPAPDGEFRTGGIAYSAAVAWPNAIVADGINGLVVVNIDGELALTGQASAPEFNSDFRSVDAQGNYAYIVDTNGTFRVYDLIDPTGPLPAGKLSVANMLDVKVKDNYAYVAAGEQGVRVIDISDPRAPVLVGEDFIELPGLAQRLAIYQDLLLVATGEAGVQMLKIKPDGQLEFAAAVNTSGKAVQLGLSPDHLLAVADEDGGLAIIQFENYDCFFPVYARSGSAKYYIPLLRR